MITISFYSYKGGVGRSLALANLAVYLAQFGAAVVMVDFDLEAPGLHYKLRPGEPILTRSGGLARLLSRATSGAALEDGDFDIAIDVTEHVGLTAPHEEDLDQPQGRLLLVPAGDPVLEEYWRDLAGIDWNTLFEGPIRPGVTALARLRAHLIQRYSPDVLLIDSRTGITPSGGVATTLLPDVVVTLLLNTPEHLDGTKVVAAAIASSSLTDDNPPRVVPVLSRYIPPDPGAPEAASFAAARVMEEDGLLDELRTTLVAGLDDELASRITRPLVLHSDVRLQQRERLSFGPHAPADVDANGGALLDDYIRLFATIVPRETFSHFVAGMRNRVRGIILDRPDDAVRTLDNLSSLVGDEEVFIDLVKVHALRRDFESMLRAAERMHDVHGTIVEHPALTGALRDLLIDQSRLRGDHAPPYRPSFLEDYWRHAAPRDSEWAAGVVRALVLKGATQRALHIAEEFLAVDQDATILAQALRTLLRRDAKSIRMATTLALQYFSAAEHSPDFIRAAALACSYEPLPDLASRLVRSPAFGTVPPAHAVEVLMAAGRHQDAGALLVETLATADVRDPSVERLSPTWAALALRQPQLRDELRAKNPEVLDVIESLRDERGRARRGVSRRFS